MNKLIPWKRLEGIIKPHYPYPLKEVNQWLTEVGVLLKEGTLVDAMIIEAPTSTKNKAGEVIQKCIKSKRQ